MSITLPTLCLIAKLLIYISIYVVTRHIDNLKINIQTLESVQLLIFFKRQKFFVEFYKKSGVYIFILAFCLVYTANPFSLLESLTSQNSKTHYKTLTIAIRRRTFPSPTGVYTSAFSF